ncbi:hypothetical protein BTUL_0108g00100 [Botrytis tulipae]|uniref:Uncharacterized protein n=1 Tax=Botrytis tulipae TaxID=87230 RepID=A0A4Z1EGB3_9HELO|nr:hypothetical protein BTUL_0108g00100 [Botrytis tulipae]
MSRSGGFLLITSAHVSLSYRIFTPISDLEKDVKVFVWEGLASLTDTDRCLLESNPTYGLGNHLTKYCLQYDIQSAWDV